MKLPLYFCFFEKDFSSSYPSELPIAAMGGHFAPDGELILPKGGEVLVVDDRTVPAASVESALAALNRAAEGYNGILFDFERPRNGFCTALLTEFVPPEGCFTIVPPAYAALCPSALVLVSGVLCNDWLAFCQKNQARWPDRWCLELRPWDEQVARPGPEAQIFHRQALCQIASHGGRYRVFDTEQTILRKLLAAESLGCQLAVGLYQELGGLLGPSGGKSQNVPSEDEKILAFGEEIW